ncbi:MAG: transglycosylase SLT domain-containing protein [Bdellovibrionales bacterium]|nr:transglycosylase SLT domain-containing protein [Bdellovibrionales bacterium]
MQISKVSRLWRVTSVVLFGLGIAGCSSAPKTTATGDRLTGEASSAERAADIKEFSARSAAPRVQTVVQADEIVIKGVKLEHTNFDFPITVNSAVEKWIDYFTGKGRKHFVKYLERSEYFIPYIRPLLRQYDLPEDLVYLAMIESGFNNHARSFAKAVGPWQFVSATGKRYGLSVNWWVDERRDTRKSTLSAAQYLKDLYGMFHSWELAAASYNAGEAKLARAVRRYGTADFWALTRHRFLRPETRDYVPKIIAAALIAKNRTQFGFPASRLNPGKGEAIAPDGEVVKLESDSTQSNTAAQKEALESVLKGEFYENASSEEIGQEETDGELMPASVESQPDPKADKDSYALAKPVATPHVNKKGEIMGEELLDFEVQSPADLLKISRAAGLSYHTVKSLNPELLRWCTPANVGTYRIKLPASSKDRFLTNYNDPKFSKRVEFLAYKVRRGQSLRSIAANFGIKVDPLADLNGISAKASLPRGALIRLPMPADGGRSLSSLEVRDPPERRRHRRRVRRSTASVRKKREVSRVSMRERMKNRRKASY